MDECSMDGLSDEWMDGWWLDGGWLNVKLLPLMSNIGSVMLLCSGDSLTVL